MPTIYVQANNVLPMICNADGCQPLCVIHPACACFDAVEVADGQNLLAILEAGDRCQRLVKTIEGHGTRGEIAILRSCVPSMRGTPKNACPIGQGFALHGLSRSDCAAHQRVLGIRRGCNGANSQSCRARLVPFRARPMHDNVVDGCERDLSSGDASCISPR